MNRILSRDSNTITVASFYEGYLLDKYNFEPAYQRLSVWSDEKQSFLIDSILKNFPMPPIFLHQHIDDKTGKTRYDVIDGKQRLNSIIRFINNEIPSSTETENDDFGAPGLSGVYFNDLDKPELADYKKSFWRYIIPIEYVDTDSADLVDNIFDRLNRNGEPLKGQELRNAKYHHTPLLELVEDLAAVDFWTVRLQHVDLTRMENYEFISELLFELLERKPLEANQRIIDDLYDKYCNKAVHKWDKVKEEFLLITDLLNSLDLDYDAYKIAGVSHLYGLWCFAHHCYSTKVDIQAVRKNLVRFFQLLRSNDLSDKNVSEYKKAMSARTKSKSQRDRRLIALQNFCGV